jgi:serine/threonine protein kinase
LTTTNLTNTPAPVNNEISVLRKVGKYEIRRELGRGAMGVVYEGFDPFIERTVAIKTIQKTLIDQSGDQEVFSRFRREAQAAGRLAHPNIVSVHEYGEDDDIAFIAMELISGKELKDYFDKAQRFPLQDSVRIMLQLLDALDYSHARGVVHRDIKPSNIVITQGGQIKVVDFGIAKIESSDLTQVGTVLGTPTYMSPEQFLGIIADRRSDIYSAGVILYQFLTGAKPFTGSMATIMHKVLNQAPVPPSTLDPEVSKALDEVVGKAMAKNPDERFQTAAEFMQALKLAINAADAPAAVASDMEATMIVNHTPQSSQINGNAQAPAHDINFDFNALMADIKNQVENEVVSAGFEAHKAASAAASAASTQPEQDDVGDSNLLAGLAREAEATLGSKQSMAQDPQANARKLHDALDRIFKFFISFAQQTNSSAPTINRAYRIDRLDRMSAYTSLTWRGASTDCRKQSPAETALLDHVSFSVRLWSATPVVVTRAWNELGALREMLDNLKLSALDDLEASSKTLKQEWAQIRLSPDIPLQIKFKGNYPENCIDVQSFNLETFGPANFKLKPEDVTTALLDEIGLFLLGRTNQLPAALHRV